MARMANRKPSRCTKEESSKKGRDKDGEQRDGSGAEPTPAAEGVGRELGRLCPEAAKVGKGAKGNTKEAFW